MGSQLASFERCSPSSIQRFGKIERMPRNWERAAPVDWERPDLDAARVAQSNRSYVGYSEMHERAIAEEEFLPLEAAENDVGSNGKVEEPSPEAENMPEYEQIMDIPEDTYGAAIMIYVKEMSEISDHGFHLVNVVKAIYGSLLLSLNNTLQLSFLWYVHINVVQPAVLKVQELYRGYHADLFDVNGEFDEEKWQYGYALKEEICQIAIASDTFLYVILLLWTISMLNELRQVAAYFFFFQKMPVCFTGREMLLKDAESISIIALTRSTRAVLYVFVLLPKLAVSFCLLLLGSRWLCSATSLEDLVMNTVALEFVIRIDDLIYTVIPPAFIRQEVEKIDFCAVKPNSGNDSDERREQIVKLMKSTSVCVCAMAFPILFTRFLQDVLPTDISDVKEHCSAYLNSRQPICDWIALRSGAIGCFPHGHGMHAEHE